jgi:hypothetical protein
MFYKSYKVELLMRIELATSSLPRKCSTTELQQQNGAKDGTQTRDPQLGRLMLYQLSYFRKNNLLFYQLYTICVLYIDE